MKKKLLFASLLLIALLFTGCDSSSSPYGTMTIINDSNETITFIEVKPILTYIDVNSKILLIPYNSLKENQVVKPTTSVGFTLPPVTKVSTFEITVMDTDTDDPSSVYVGIDDDYVNGTDFTLNYKGYEDFELTGEGVTLF